MYSIKYIVLALRTKQLKNPLFRISKNIKPIDYYIQH